MIKYRAILIDPGNSTAERPLQMFSNSRPVIDEWAEKVLAKAVSPFASVTIFEQIEELVATIRKDGAEGPPAKRIEPTQEPAKQKGVNK